jgi:hypothetical protein
MSMSMNIPSHFFTKKIINDFSEKIDNMKYKFYMMNEYNITDIATICVGIGSSYSEKLIKSIENNPEKFDIAVMVNADADADADTDENVIGFIIVELGECQHFPNAYSVKLICSKNSGSGTMLMGLYLYTLLSHHQKKDMERIGLLDLAGSYENIGGLCMYEKFGFMYNPAMRLTDKNGNKCFTDMNNLPMIVNIDKQYLGENDEVKKQEIIDIVNGVNRGLEKSKICYIKNKDIQKLVGYLRILDIYFENRISLQKNTRSNVIEMYDLFDNNREALKYIIKYIEDTGGAGKVVQLNRFVENLTLYNTKKKIQISSEIQKEIDDMINKINVIISKNRVNKKGGKKTIKNKRKHKKNRKNNKSKKTKNNL